MSRIALICALGMLPAVAGAEPSCVIPQAKNFVLGSTRSTLADGWSSQWLLQSVDSSKRIFMKRCSGDAEIGCYFATDVEPGKYYFQEAVPNVRNGMDYPVSKPALWIEITGNGVDYIGDWTILRGDRRVINKLQVAYRLKTLDEMVALCQLSGRRQFLDQTRTKALEIVE